MARYSMGFLQTAVAVVTGAGSGIGRALAERLAASGAALALADIDAEGLAETASLLPPANVSERRARVTTHVLDVSDETAMAEFAREAVARHGRVSLLININFWGSVYGTRHFLPELKKQRRAHIVNLSSIFGLIAPAGQSAYCASKFAVRGFTESLRHELEGTNVFVTSVHPGGIATPIAKRARLGANTPAAAKTDAEDLFRRLARLPPEFAAEAILRGIEERRGRVLVGRDAKRLDILQRLRPATYWRFMSERYLQGRRL